MAIIKFILLFHRRILTEILPLFAYNVKLIVQSRIASFFPGDELLIRSTWTMHCQNRMKVRLLASEYLKWYISFILILFLSFLLLMSLYRNICPYSNEMNFMFERDISVHIKIDILIGLKVPFLLSFFFLSKWLFKLVNTNRKSISWSMVM